MSRRLWQRWVLFLVAMIFGPILALKALAFDPSFSQERGEHEMFAAARARHDALRAKSRSRTVRQGESAESVATDWSAIDVREIPVWTRAQVEEGFARMRDTRFLEMASMPGFARRSSWLYPDDGCFARAALADWNLARWGFPEPKKLFAFGRLVAQTPNTISGWVSWWYHIVPVVRVEGQVMALDPSIEPRRALSFEQWVSRMGGGSPEDFHFSVCAAHAYAPYSPCFEPSSDEDSAGYDDQVGFLESEWARLRELNRDPERELGDAPPWLVSPLD